MSLVRWFRLVACIEAVSYLILVGAAVAKRAMDAPGLVSTIGPVHGVIFLVYLGLALSVREHVGWSLLQTLTAIVAAAIPFGGFYVERRMLATTTG